MAKSTFRILILLALTLPFMAPRPAHAVVYDVLTTYYTGSCPYGLTYNGFKWKECSGTITQDGTLSGTWRCDDTYNCTEGGAMVYHWYERCNNAWVYRYTSGGGVNTWPSPGDCHCT